jgi:cephalosporin-C deacetylase-like acetyl esterase
VSIETLSLVGEIKGFWLFFGIISGRKGFYEMMAMRVLFLSVLLAVGGINLTWGAGAGIPLKFHFDPALMGGSPSLKVLPTADAANTTLTYKLTAYAVDSPLAVLAVKEYTSKDTVDFQLPNRGKKDFLGVKAELLTESTTKTLAQFRALYLPEGKPMDYKGHPQLKKPADFDRFWEKKLKELRQTPMNATITLADDQKSSTGDLYKVTLNSYHNVTIACWYYVPKGVDPINPIKGKKPYPAIQIMPGYGSGEPPVDRTAEGYITLSLSPRGLGQSSTYFKIPSAYHLPDLDNPDDYYYVGAYLDCVRGIDFLFSRPEVDCLRIAAEGGSQGGALTLALAGLDKRLAAACANVPALSNFRDIINISLSGTAVTWKPKMDDPAIGKKVMQTLNYIDVANMATRIETPTMICVGLQDITCPSLNGVVAYNRLPKNTPSRFVIDPEAPHSVTKLMREANKEWYDKWIGEN